MRDYLLMIHPRCDTIEYKSYKEKKYNTGNYLFYSLFCRISSSFIGSGNGVLDTRNHQHKDSDECGDECRVFYKSFQNKHNAPETRINRTYVFPCCYWLILITSTHHSGNLFCNCYLRSFCGNHIPKTSEIHTKHK